MHVKKMITNGLLCAALLGVITAQADDQAIGRATAHGGMVQAAGDYTLELVIRDNYLELYLMDSRGMARNSQGIRVAATVAEGNGNHALNLKPYHGNQFVAQGKFAADGVSVVILKIETPDGGQDAFVFTKQATAAGEDTERWAGYEDDILYGWEG